MGKQQDWKKVSTLRKIVKDMKTKAVKCKRTGNMKGGVILTDEAVKPYMEELANLEAKLAKEKEEMSTGERVDTAAAEVIADAEQNKDEIKEYIAEQFAKLAPKKFTQQINKWAYIAAKGSGDYYKTLSGQIFPRKGDIPEECTFIHKVRVHECIDNDLDIYKYFHEDGTAGSEKGIESFQFISQVGMKVSLKECALPPALEKFAGMEGKIENEPVANKAMSDKDIFDISFPTKTKRGNSTTTRKVRREFLNIQTGKDDECNTKEEVSFPSYACDSTREGGESPASISVSGMEEETESMAAVFVDRLSAFGLTDLLEQKTKVLKEMVAKKGMRAPSEFLSLATQITILKNKLVQTDLAKKEEQMKQFENLPAHQQPKSAMISLKNKIEAERTNHEKSIEDQAKDLIAKMKVSKS